MTVLAKSGNLGGIAPLTKAVFRLQPIPEPRPVTATLDCPAILDITFLKKLDMTSFTKKGLIAISKICGITLVKRTDDKKIRKRLKRQTVERAKKEARKKSRKASEESTNGNVTNPKRTTLKSPPKINVPDSPSNRKKNDGKSINPKTKSKEASKPSVDDILYGPIDIVVTEPCNTCGRSEHPERLHSHPKKIPGRKEQKKAASQGVTPAVSEDKLLSPRAKSTTRRHSTGHIVPEPISGFKVADLEPSFHSDHEIETIKMLPESKRHNQKLNSTKSIDCGVTKNKETSSKTTRNACKKSDSDRSNPKSGSATEPNTSDSSLPEDLKYVTGCYVCGKQMSHEVRFAHEEECIAEWRKNNRSLPPDDRKAEPLRPDFRFTETGAVDFKGTFNSIWANHMDSLVPCVKCKRTFFPDRIERHEACCNKQPMKPKHPTPRKKFNTN